MRRLGSVVASKQCTFDLGDPDCGVLVLQLRLSKLRPNNRFTYDSTHYTLLFGALC